MCVFMCICVRTCEVCIMRRVDDVVRQGETHVFRLVQFLWWDDSVLITGEVTGESLESDDAYITHTHTQRHIPTNKGIKVN